MKITEGLEPQLVWNYFEEITKVPRPSKKEEKIIAYLVDFANKNGLVYKKDDIGNIVIIREASKGKEASETVILQSHVDMVCEKNSDVVIDFDNDPIDIYIEDGWVKARGTTLGADCGIGMAMAMAILTDDTIFSPRIEALFTVDEETGLTGAFELGENMLTGKYFINLDSEDEGEIYIGCAGGVDTVADFAFKKEPIKKGKICVSVSVSGLCGGHSGDDINKNLGNSNIILCRFLGNRCENVNYKVVSISGGNLRNAIPRDAEAILAIDPNDLEKLKINLSNFEEIVKNEHTVSEPNVKLSLREVECLGEAIENEVAMNIIKAVISAPNGVQAMSQHIEGFVETSTNLASIKIIDNNIQIVTSQRSSIESKKVFVSSQLNKLFANYGGVVKHSDGYPGWTPVPTSVLLDKFKNEYKEIFVNEIDVKVIHAGLECGLILKKYPDLDMVSIGPTLRGVHSPDERLEVKTVSMCWNLLVAVIENI